MRNGLFFRFPLSASIPWFLGLVVVLVIAQQVIWKPMIIQPDSPRYAVMAMNLLYHGTINFLTYSADQPPKPDHGEGGVLAAFEMILAAMLHEETRRTLICIAQEGGHAGRNCHGSLASLKLIYVIEIAVFLLAVYRISMLILEDSAKAWLAVMLALACRDTRQHAASMLSEPLFLMVTGLFFWAWLLAWLRPAGWKYWLLAGISLGLMTLSKPVWSVAPAFLLAMMLVAALWKWLDWRNAARGAVVLVLGFALLVAPLVVRNALQFGGFAISDPNYLAMSLTHRLAFNLMTWPEWLIGWLYYLPNFGDNLATKLFGVGIDEKLAWGEASYYQRWPDLLTEAQTATATDREAASYLVRNYIFGDMLKNLAVTALLAFRGMFVGSGWALLAFLLLAPVLRRLTSRERGLWLLLFLPAIIMTGFQAQISVSLRRYNLALIPALSIILAISAAVLFEILHKIPLINRFWLRVKSWGV